jgi:heat-inducible transcriptional repressor
MSLSERQKHVLKIIIKEHSSTGQPVGSKTLVEQYNLGISPATVRNEMAVLEKDGYLAQPHTSAGRVPTEKGYRYFVRELMGEIELPTQEQLMIRHQFHQARLELDQWMRLSAAVLAHSTRSASWVTSPKISTCKIKHVELISIHDYVVLLILVLQGGTIKQQILNLDIAYSQEDLHSISRRLTDLWVDADVTEVLAYQSTLIGLAWDVATVVIDTMQRINARQSSDVYHDGLLNILTDGETNHNDALQQVVRAIEERNVVDQLVGQAIEAGGVQVIIGGEGKWDDLSQVSIVLSSYGIDNGVTGALGVIGPIRMRYARAVSIVRYMSRLMSDLMTDLYGPRLSSPQRTEDP